MIPREDLSVVVMARGKEWQLPEKASIPRDRTVKILYSDRSANAAVVPTVVGVWYDNNPALVERSSYMGEDLPAFDRCEIETVSQLIDMLMAHIEIIEGEVV
jgi:hypothetical protein